MAPKRLTREQSRQQTRDRLLAAAAELFAERGVNGASVEQIAERAGYSRGAFYGNFDDKQELVLELLERRTLAELEEVAALRREAPSFEAALEPLRAWNRARARHRGQWLTLRLELLLYALRNPKVRPQVAQRERLARNAIAEGIQRELSAHHAAPPADPAFLAAIVHALEDGLLIQRLICPDGLGDEVVVDAVALLVRSWAALGTDQDDPPPYPPPTEKQ